MSITNTRWQLIVYPWKYKNPVLKSQGYKEEKSKVDLSLGPLSCQFSRSKDNPYGTCDINFFGPLPEDIYKGNWVLLKSYDGETQYDDGENQGIIRFFGQIFNVRTRYVLNEGGGLSQISSVSVREWSFFYSCPVRMDTYAMIHTVQSGYIKAGFLNQDLPPSAAKMMDELVKATVNPFQFSGIVLSFISALSNKGVASLRNANPMYLSNLNNINIKDLTLPDVALLLPIFPLSLLEDLGVDIEDVENPLGSGLVETRFGIYSQTSSSESFQKDWNGIFDDVNSWLDGYEDKGDRPLYSGIVNPLTQGLSAWELLQTTCDASINEVFSDLVYFRKDGKIGAQPFLLMRDRPFALKAFLDVSGIEKSKWSVFDDLPRINIDSQYIETIDLSDSFTNSPNYVRVQYTPNGALSKDLTQVYSELYGTFRLEPEMRRFGGQPFFLQTPYLNQNAEFMTSWYKDVATIATLWHSYAYRSPSCQLVLKDNNIPFTIGVNATFKMGNFEFVGHISSYSVTHSISDRGTKKTTSVLYLEKLCVVSPSGQLTYMPPELFQNIFNRNVEIKDPEGSNVADMLDNAEVKGFL